MLGFSELARMISQWPPNSFDLSNMRTFTPRFPDGALNGTGGTSSCSVPRSKVVSSRPIHRGLEQIVGHVLEFLVRKALGRHRDSGRRTAECSHLAARAARFLDIVTNSQPTTRELLHLPSARSRSSRRTKLGCGFRSACGTTMGPEVSTWPCSCSNQARYFDFR